MGILDTLAGLFGGRRVSRLRRHLAAIEELDARVRALAPSETVLVELPEELNLKVDSLRSPKRYSIEAVRVKRLR